MVLDAGGGTIDITVHEVQESNTLREVRAANGGAWGGTLVNKAFEEFLREIVGDLVIESFKMKDTEDWLYMSLQFEAKKRQIEIKSPRYITFRLPLSLIELCERLNGMHIRDAVAASKYAEIVDIVRDKLKLSKVVFFYMFGQTLQRTVDHVKFLFRETTIREVDIILMVGGFSESQLLQGKL
ncbi:heat shock 70 kDa protein 12B-like [Ruditapes philippinarum]|uniref:heat shock 70 kDa protein 12B-like n=1 Tax=Ruditapes philippinarum TaxID=129788 RepID=UPI00295B4840|nr:heat shock 70 kDa protein 12B-like [Ruditapes philippinarum]